METKKRPIGRPEGKNFEFIKSIKLNQKQIDNWDNNTPKLIRNLLELENNPIELLKQLYDFMSKMDFVNYIPNDQEMQLVEQIKEMIQ